MPVCGEKRIPTDPLEISRLAENELSRLLRQYRIMENDRVAFAEESNPKLRLQRQVIKGLESDKQALETDLKVTKSIRNRKKDAQITKDLLQLLNEQQRLNEHIANEKAHVTETEYEIKKATNEIRKFNKTQLTDRKLDEKIWAARKLVTKLENQLDVAMKKFNSILGENEKIRGEIDNLIAERAHFNALWNKMVTNLSLGKKYMLDLVEQATLAYDQRDEWCGKLDALKDRGRADLIQHIQDMRELQRTLDHDAKLNEYLGVKGQRRIMNDLEEHEMQKRQARRDQMQIHLREYEYIFQQIKDFAQEDNIERLASQFIKQEEENFALFKYVNELNFELETLNETVDTYKKKIDAQRQINDDRAKTQVVRIKELQNNAKLAKDQTTASEKELTMKKKKLNETLLAIGKLFQQVKADNSPILELLGQNTTVNIFNVHLYLEILEKRTNELIQVVYYKDHTAEPKMRPGKKKSAAKPTILEPSNVNYKILKIDKIVLTQPCPLCVEREVVTEVVKTIPDNPDNRKEVQEKLRKRLQLPDALDRLHNVSACKLPASRLILQKRFA